MRFPRSPNALRLVALAIFLMCFVLLQGEEECEQTATANSAVHENSPRLLAYRLVGEEEESRKRASGN